MGVEHATPGMLIMLALIVGPILIFIARARRGQDLYVRRIPGVDAIYEALGRSAELGRSVSFTTGLTGVSPVLYACLGILSSIAARVARYKSKLLVPQSQPEALAMIEDVLHDAYREEGRLANFDPNCVMYLSDEQFAFASGYIGMIQRENVGSAFMFGTFAAESLLLAEAGQQIGAMQIAGSVSPEQVPFFITACDYTLIGEELFAASAYLTREPVQLGSLVGQDRGKILILIMVLCGACIATWNGLFPLSVVKNLDYLLNFGWF